MKYLRIIINPTNAKERQTVVDALRTTTENPPIVDDVGDLYLSLNNEIDLIGEVFSLGVSCGQLEYHGIDDPFDFEIVHRRVLPPEIAMAMN